MEIRAASPEPPLRIERHDCARRGNPDHRRLPVSATATQTGTNRLMT